ncbi:hypothetical protein AVEN_203116-1 [Araneus ventricosus]|uniref:Uncharacterized protein n=1 Tax=Araneus ventricosus TaxID=182803 RepID=A0A4Y2DPU0_ARAVE|nr:hypothetical protein AVEN_203116-1 [Araneus ventricosus]
MFKVSAVYEGRLEHAVEWLSSRCSIAGSTEVQAACGFQQLSPFVSSLRLDTPVPGDGPQEKINGVRSGGTYRVGVLEELFLRIPKARVVYEDTQRMRSNDMDLNIITFFHFSLETITDSERCSLCPDGILTFDKFASVS